MDSLSLYMENLDNLPVELQKNLTLMGDLDSRAQDIICNIDKLTDDYMMNVNLYSARKKTETMAYIQRQFIKTKEYGDDKVQLSIQTYELVDKQIRRLDLILAYFEAKIKDTQIAMKNLEEDEQNQGWKKTNNKEIKKKSVNAKIEKETVTKNSKKKQQKKVGTEKINAILLSKFSSIHDANLTNLSNSVDNVALNTGSLTGIAGSTHTADLLDMPVDPNEPTYCLCNEVSFGEMIGCDNLECPIEWFHFGCVQLTTKPKGKWFCPKCRTDKKKK